MKFTRASGTVAEVAVVEVDKSCPFCERAPEIIGREYATCNTYGCALYGCAITRIKWNRRAPVKEGSDT